MSKPHDPTQEFQTAIIETVIKASQDGVPPAIVYTVLGGLQMDVLTSIKQANRMAKEDEAAETAEAVLKSKNQQPSNVIPLPKTDSTN